MTRMQLLHDLSKSIIQRRRPSAASPELWKALARLAVLTLQAQRPVSTTAIGNEAQIWQLTDTRFVVEHNGTLSFALPVFEQHFGAQSISSGTIEIEAAASRDSFPSWRYAIASVIATCSGSAEREQLLCRVARTSPAALSWVLDEIEPENTRRKLNVVSHEAASSQDRNAGAA
ncbi:hypothetical protein ABH935_006372 [Catenulispora sp. GAS73]|uniref:hypothetical protein n=1 Tax=Catenulispora sp. GAS73 TaxID=3156269 RepID=UPI003516988C